jgi:adenine phosphoribosyltransferase
VIEIHEDAVSAGEPVLLIDDLIATGGTAEAAVRLLRKLNAEVIGASFVIELTDLDGRSRLAKLGVPCHSLLTFEGD